MAPAQAAAGAVPWAPFGAGGVAPAGGVRGLTGARVGVMGLGVSGLAMATLLQARGAQLVLVDARGELATTLRAAFPGAALSLGPDQADPFLDCAAVALSPGVDPRHPAVARALARGTWVFGEVELLAWRTPRALTAAITGTNGKSTTTALCGALLHATGGAAFVGGNLGEPISGWLAAGAAEPAAVLELSSYQIDGAWDYAPEVATVLNVAPDHLARYGDVTTYARSKARLLEALAPDGVAVLNADDARVRNMAPTNRRALWFGTTPALPGPGLWWDASADRARAVHAADTELALAPLALALAHPTLLGAHNRANACAALLVGAALRARLVAAGAAPTFNDAALGAALARGYAAFAGLPHRLAPVKEVGGVQFVDDSKATNDASAATAVAAMATPYVLLVGGLDDASEPTALRAALLLRPPRAVVAFGAAGPRLARALVGAGVRAGFAVQQQGDLQAACVVAAALARPGETVLLSPACKSFDAFADYRARGRAFAAWVKGHAAARQPAP